MSPSPTLEHHRARRTPLFTGRLCEEHDYGSDYNRYAPCVMPRSKAAPRRHGSVVSASGNKGRVRVAGFTPRGIGALVNCLSTFAQACMRIGRPAGTLAGI